MIRVFATRELPVMDIIELQGRIVITPEALADAREAQQLRHAARQKRRAEARNGATEATAATESNPPRSPSLSSSSSVEEEDSVLGGEASQEAMSNLKGASTALSDGNSTRVEVPLGHVEQDHLSEKRCTLCIDTLRVDGSRSTYKHPLLVLKACSPARMRQLRRVLAQRVRAVEDVHQEEGPTSNSVSSSPINSDEPASSTVLFSEWLEAHPEALELNSLYLDDMVSENTADGGGPVGALASAPAARKRLREESEEGNDQSPAPSTSSGSASSSYTNYELVGVVRGSVLFNSKPARVFQ